MNNCAVENSDCAGNCGGLHSLAINKKGSCGGRKMISFLPSVINFIMYAVYINISILFINI